MLKKRNSSGHVFHLRIAMQNRDIFERAREKVNLQNELRVVYRNDQNITPDWPHRPSMTMTILASEFPPTEDMVQWTIQLDKEKEHKPLEFIKPDILDEMQDRSFFENDRDATTTVLFKFKIKSLSYYL